MSPSTFKSIRCSSSASSCSASCDSSGAPAKQMMMTLMLSKLPCREKRFGIRLKLASSDVLLSLFDHKPPRLIDLCHTRVFLQYSKSF